MTDRIGLHRATRPLTKADEEASHVPPNDDWEQIVMTCPDSVSKSRPGCP